MTAYNFVSAGCPLSKRNDALLYKLDIIPFLGKKEVGEVRNHFFYIYFKRVFLHWTWFWKALLLDGPDVVKSPFRLDEITKVYLAGSIGHFQI